MKPKRTLPLEQLGIALVGALVATSLVVLAPAVAGRLRPAATEPSPTPSSEPSPPPAGVLLPEELDRDLQGVMILVNDRSFGTAFQVDSRGSFLTAASLVAGGKPLRLVDNTGGSHPVRVVGIDNSAGVALVQADAGGTALTLGDSSSVRSGDSLVILASAKVVNLRAATPAVVARADSESITVRADDLPGEYGGPVVGPGGTVLGLLTGHAAVLPTSVARLDLAQWRNRPGELAPLAALPPDLVLRGSGDATTPSAGLALTSINPTRASSAQTTQVSLNGNGFLAGAALSVRFVPVASPSGTFLGSSPTVVSSSVITVKIPAGSPAQDYVVELTNGDGSSVSSRAAFTVTP